MPKHTGVYQDASGAWYFKVRTHRDPLTGRWVQVTRRGFRSAADASRARRELLDDVAERPPVLPVSLTVSELVALYLDDAEANQRLSVKTLFDYRHSVADYVEPYLGTKPVRDVTPETIAAWQRQLALSGGRRAGQALQPNTIRLARAPLSGAFKMAVAQGIVRTNPVTAVSPPRAQRSVPKHWTPDQARDFLALMEGDRLWPVWAFALSSGVRIGELVWLRWPNVDLDERVARITEFASCLGYEVVPSKGKSRDAVRSIDIDDGLVGVLRQQRKRQAEEELASTGYERSDYVFTRPEGGAYHPQALSRLLGSLSTECGLPRLTAHGLRHTSATLMLASGVPPKVAAERLGHADPTLFTNLYSHVTPTMQREAADKLGKALWG